MFLFQLAFIVTFGVLLDAILVRSLVVPALVHDLGRSVWWPWRKRIPSGLMAEPHEGLADDSSASPCLSLYLRILPPTVDGSSSR
jgi:uncharacterized membrane protein YdfJ with MMPL/SSD domain